MDKQKIIAIVNQITDADNVTLDDAFEHLAMIYECSKKTIERIWVQG